MPTLTAGKASLQRLLDMEFTDEYLEQMLFDFGLEVDDVLHEEDVQYRIEIPANRYDLLCVEGLGMALRAYLGAEQYKDIVVEDGDVVVHHTAAERPHVACAVVKDVDLGGKRYKSFIEYQDKLHLTIGRNRLLSSVGTHDLSRIQTPVFYKSDVPENIRLVPLNGDREIDGRELGMHFPPGSKINKYVRLVENDEKLTYFEDSRGEVMSLPPVINSEHTKIGSDTKDVFIEVTGTNFHRVNTMLKLLLYCFRGRRVESVEIVRGDERLRTPVMHNRVFSLRLDEVNRSLGLDLAADVVERYLGRMMHQATWDGETFAVRVHDVRSDVLHKCDLVEDIAVAHGFNNLARSIPTSFAVGSEIPLNRFSDKLRMEFAMMGFNEALTLTLLSKSENVLDGDRAVVLRNPKSSGYEVARTSLIPGLLKTVASNLHVKAPFKVFEVADVVLLDGKNVCGARNARRLGAVYAGTSAHLEDIQGPLSLLLEKCGVSNYSFTPMDDSRYLRNQSAAVAVGDAVLGSVGVCNPEICQQFRIPYAVSFLEIDVELLFSIK